MSIVQGIMEGDKEVVVCSLCNERIELPHSDGPYLRAAGEVWFPVLVAVRCPKCKAGWPAKVKP
jgi:hypothetical protein